jgi:hypothetical protein
MATATNEVERIVRKVLKEEQDETVSDIKELSTLLTEQVIPKLSNGGNGESDWDPDDDADQDDAVSMSAYDDEGTTSRRGKPSPNGEDEGDDADLPEQEIPRPVIEAFTTLYRRGPRRNSLGRGHPVEQARGGAHCRVRRDETALVQRPGGALHDRNRASGPQGQV